MPITKAIAAPTIADATNVTIGTIRDRRSQGAPVLAVS